MRVAKSGLVFVAQFLICLIPASMVVYRLIYSAHMSVAVLVFRPVILGVAALLCCLLWSGARVTGIEKRLAGTLSILCSVILLTSLVAVDPTRALQEWSKLVIMGLISIMLCRPLRHRPTAKVFGAALVVTSTAIAVLIVALYVRYMGLAVPTYAATRAYKAVVDDQLHIPLNPVAFECLFSYVAGMGLLRTSRPLLSLGGVLLLVCSTLTGSRTPFAASVASGLLLIVLNAFQQRRLVLRFAGWLLVAAMVTGAVFAGVSAGSQAVADVTEGRWELWSVALHKFAERPILGFGYSSAEDDPGYIAGGYHSEYLTALAEQGIIGTIAVLNLFWFLFRCCWKLAFRPTRTSQGQWVLLGCLILLIRAGIETPGLFGSAQGPADFLAYIFLASVVGQMSTSEDRAMSNRALQVRSSPHFMQIRDAAQAR